MQVPRDIGHDEIVIGMLKANPGFANEYLATALTEADLQGGQFVLLAALRHIVQARGMSSVAARAGMPRESLHRALSSRGNPTIKTLLAVVLGTDLHLQVCLETLAA